MTVAPLAPQPCPACGQPLTCVGYPDTDPDPRPREGDITICQACAATLRLNAELRAILLWPRDIAALPGEAQDAIAAYRQTVLADRAAQQVHP